MTIPRRLRASTVLPTLALGAILTLGACGDDPATELSERLAENSLGGDVDIDRDGEAFSITTDDGTVVAGTGSLPEGFPDIPLVEGPILSAVVVDGADGDAGNGWAVGITADGETATIVADAAEALVDAGFTTDESAAVPGIDMAQLSNGNYEVLVSATANGDGSATVQYVVSPR